MNYVTTHVIPTVKQVHDPADNTAAVVTIAAPGAGKRTVLKSVTWSYLGTPTGGQLTISDAGVTIVDFDITTAGPGALVVDIPAGVNTEVIITLAAAGAAVGGKLSVQSHPTEAAANVAVA